MAEVMRKAVDDFIRPGYRDLLEGTETLAEAAHMLCEKPSDETLGDVQMSFDEVIQQWSTIEIVRVGPVIEGNRFERFLFFPDRKSTGLKQVQRILATNDETAASAQTLKGKERGGAGARRARICALRHGSRRPDGGKERLSLPLWCSHCRQPESGGRRAAC